MEGEGATAGMILPFHPHGCISQCISPSAFLWQWQLGAEEVRGSGTENERREKENGREEERERWRAENLEEMETLDTD